MHTQHHDLIETIQRNCHIADARHAGDYTLCVYLLKMREFYRWEKRIRLSDVVVSNDVGEWLTQREAVWDALDEQDYAPLPLNGSGEHDPFANETINAELNSKGLVYSAGYGRRCRPLFFLAELEQVIEQDGYTILVAGRELARDVEAPPAMNQGKQVFIRRESLRRMVWEKVDEWRWSGLDNPMGRALACYDFDADVEAALDALAAAETETVVAHEIGEVKAGQLLGDAAWQAMLFALPPSHADIMLRSVRDLLADCLHTLPELLARGNAASIHFYFGNLSAMRKKLAPQLIAAYQHWHETGDAAQIAAYAVWGREHWAQVGREALALFQAKALESLAEIEAMISKNLNA
ncbi:MAG: hypothetical protein BWK73_19025 [Thiothrix lacustris]|uniref:Uncharacterized protein n=1 Tax=Thiothrix lacustris TaxID=525917 RepID=A0A1Y1QQ57_9GAMM|nr:MAG: hypothetical protein BWK73_19025 [Thiothrix lacustris]